MKQLELYGRVRYAVIIQGMSRRKAARMFGIDRRTVDKMVAFPEPPGYRRKKTPARPKLDPYVGIIDQILEGDTKRLKKQRHTSKRIFERLRDEYGFAGGITIVKDYIFAARQRQQEMFVPLSHPPGHAQADFGEADVIIAGVEYRAHYFVMTLPHSDACFVAAYPAATTEAWLDGHNRAFAFFGGVPQSILYDNDKSLVARILPDGTRQRTRAFSSLLSHYLFEDRYGRPGKGNDKGPFHILGLRRGRNGWLRPAELHGAASRFESGGPRMAIWQGIAVTDKTMSCTAAARPLASALSVIGSRCQFGTPQLRSTPFNRNMRMDACPNVGRLIGCDYS